MVNEYRKRSPTSPRTWSSTPSPALPCSCTCPVASHGVRSSLSSCASMAVASSTRPFLACTPGSSTPSWVVAAAVVVTVSVNYCLARSHQHTAPRRLRRQLGGARLDGGELLDVRRPGAVAGEARQYREHLHRWRQRRCKHCAGVAPGLAGPEGEREEGERCKTDEWVPHRYLH